MFILGVIVGVTRLTRWKHHREFARSGRFTKIWPRRARRERVGSNLLGFEGGQTKAGRQTTTAVKEWVQVRTSVD